MIDETKWEIVSETAEEIVLRKKRELLTYLLSKNVVRESEANFMLSELDNKPESEI